MLRLESNGLVVIGNGSVLVAFFPISDAPVVKGHSVVGIQSDLLGVVRNGSVEVAFAPISGTPVGKGESVLRIESHRLAGGSITTGTLGREAYKGFPKVPVNF